MKTSVEDNINIQQDRQNKFDIKLKGYIEKPLIEILEISKISYNEKSIKGYTNTINKSKIHHFFLKKIVNKFLDTLDKDNDIVLPILKKEKIPLVESCNIQEKQINILHDELNYQIKKFEWISIWCTPLIPIYKQVLRIYTIQIILIIKDATDTLQEKIFKNISPCSRNICRIELFSLYTSELRERIIRQSFSEQRYGISIKTKHTTKRKKYNNTTKNKNTNKNKNKNIKKNVKKLKSQTLPKIICSLLYSGGCIDDIYTWELIWEAVLLFLQYNTNNNIVLVKGHFLLLFFLQVFYKYRYNLVNINIQILNILIKQKNLQKKCSKQQNILYVHSISLWEYTKDSDIEVNVLQIQNYIITIHDIFITKDDIKNCIQSMVPFITCLMIRLNTIDTVIEEKFYPTIPQEELYIDKLIFEQFKYVYIYNIQLFIYHIYTYFLPMIYIIEYYTHYVFQAC